MKLGNEKRNYIALKANHLLHNKYKVHYITVYSLIEDDSKMKLFKTSIFGIKKHLKAIGPFQLSKSLFQIYVR